MATTLGERWCCYFKLAHKEPKKAYKGFKHMRSCVVDQIWDLSFFSLLMHPGIFIPVIAFVLPVWATIVGPQVGVNLAKNAVNAIKACRKNDAGSSSRPK